MMKKVALVALLLVLVVVAGWFALRLRRPPRRDLQVELFQGITYMRDARSDPRPLMIHIIGVDLAAPGLSFLVPPGDERSGMDLPARTTGAFLEEFDLQVAINGSFSEPFDPGTLWSYYPKRGDPVNIMGLAISNGETYSDDYPHFPVLCISEGDVRISEGGCPMGTVQALAGNRLLLRDGVSVAGDDPTLHPRTAVALDAAGRRLWLVVVDGRQPGYSEGVSIAELAGIVLDLGAHVALNLDGGGSSTLVVEGAWGARALNAPIHTRMPMRQRPVGNHLGMYAEPGEETE